MSKEYYFLSISGGGNRRGKYVQPADGCIKCMPITEIGFLYKTNQKTMRVEKTSYISLARPIAEKVEDHFEDLITGEIITYDESAIRNYSPYCLREISSERLEKELEKEGLTCFNYDPVSPIFVADFLKTVQNDKKIIEAYTKDIYRLKSKIDIKDELEIRKINEIDNKRKTEGAIEEIENAKNRAKK